MSVALGRASLAEARREAQSDPARGAVHRLPCRVHRTGPARVAAFFSPAVRTGDGGELATSFRGRELKGRAVPLPPGYSGVVVREESAGTSLRHEVTTTTTPPIAGPRRCEPSRPSRPSRTGTWRRLPRETTRCQWPWPGLHWPMRFMDQKTRTTSDGGHVTGVGVFIQ
ncbi:ribonuclease H2 subunit C isoform X2 [Lampetra fluviatilis]